MTKQELAEMEAKLSFSSTLADIGMGVTIGEVLKLIEDHRKLLNISCQDCIENRKEG